MQRSDCQDFGGERNGKMLVKGYKVSVLQDEYILVMYVCESWTIKKADHQRIDGFELLGLNGNQTNQF